MTRKLRIAALIASLAAGSALGGVARAADAPSGGFYGGIALRDGGAQQGVAIGNAGNLQRFGSPLGDVWASQALVFGGYRWRNELSLEAALGSGAGYRLPGRGGVGLMLPQGYDQGARAWNLDVIGNWGFWRSFSLYGRLGYAQSDMAPQYGTSIASPIDRRQRDGLSYGARTPLRHQSLAGAQARVRAHREPVGCEQLRVAGRRSGTVRTQLPLLAAAAAGVRRFSFAKQRASCAFHARTSARHRPSRLPCAASRSIRLGRRVARADRPGSTDGRGPARCAARARRRVRRELEAAVPCASRSITTSPDSTTSCATATKWRCSRR